MRRRSAWGAVGLAAAMGWSSVAEADTLPGRCMRFDGRDDIVRVKLRRAMDEPRTVTLESWVFAEDVDEGGIAGMWGAGGLADRYQLYYENGDLVARIEVAGGGVFTAKHSTPVGAWFHAAMTYDGTDLHLYLNGAQVASSVAPGALASVGQDLIIGREEIFAGAPHFFRGRLDEVRLWKQAKSALEMSHHYNQLVDPASEGLLGSWSFQEAVGDQVVQDSTSFAHDGTLGFDTNVDLDDPGRVPSDAPVRWADLGEALAGVSGLPRFEAWGLLTPASIASFRVANARPNTLAMLIVGGTRIDAPFGGGTLVPTPDFIFFGPIDAAGENSLDFVWPGGVPPCTNLYMQWWIPDAAGVAGWAATNALRLETP